MNSSEKIVSLIDLTILNQDDTLKTVEGILAKASNKLGQVAAVCLYPQFVGYARQYLPQDIAVVTVVNFPHGNMTLKEVELQVKFALEQGADEIDLVIPYYEYIDKANSPLAKQLVRSCKALCQDKLLKVIIESGELENLELIKKATKDAIEAGADFIKTSTGKTKVGATLEAAKIILAQIQQMNSNVGFKASGGIKTQQAAQQYIDLAYDICDDNYVVPQSFRFGVSSLLDQLLQRTVEQNDGY